MVSKTTQEPCLSSSSHHAPVKCMVPQKFLRNKTICSSFDFVFQLLRFIGGQKIYWGRWGEIISENLKV